MHELSIAEAIINSTLDEVSKQGGGKVEEVGLRIGSLSGVMPDALEFAYEIAVRDTALDGSVINMEVIPATGKCAECGELCSFEMTPFMCPACGSFKIDLERGYELDIAYIRIETS
jgi:hydrogenase nickel incorporation protein HypA/HybF